MFMVLRTTTADENLSQGAPVARPATGKRFLAVPHAGGVRHSQKSSSTAQRGSFHLSTGIIRPPKAAGLSLCWQERNRLLSPGDRPAWPAHRPVPAPRLSLDAPRSAPRLPDRP